MEKGIFYLICTLAIIGAVAAFTVSVDKKIDQLNAKLSLKPTPVALIVAPTATPSATPTATLKFYQRGATPTKAVK